MLDFKFFLMKVLTVLGARPQFIKASVVSKSFESFDIKETILHTGQHFDKNMSEVFFNQLKIKKPTYNLGISGGNHGSQTGNMIVEIEKVILNEEPDCVVLYGDTNSTLAGAIAASKLKTKIAHVEAGLRSFNRYMPEEINRILTDRISDFLFTPSDVADTNLLNEGIQKDKICNIGDVMYDAVLRFGKLAEEQTEVLKKLELGEKSFVLVTIHRAENTDNKKRLLEIFRNLEILSKDVCLVLPLHPRTKKQLELIGFDIKGSSIFFIDPIGYLEMITLEKAADLIITDSGGVQKEAYFNETRCLVIRNETEWTELVNLGYNELLLDLDNLIEASFRMMNEKLDVPLNIYGDGNASNKIASILVKKMTNL